MEITIVIKNISSAFHGDVLIAMDRADVQRFYCAIRIRMSMQVCQQHPFLRSAI